MTRRERMERIIASHTDYGRQPQGAILDLYRREGLSILTDKAIEKLARNLASAWARQQKLNRENRARYHAAQERSAS